MMHSSISQLAASITSKLQRQTVIHRKANFAMTSVFMFIFTLMFVSNYVITGVTCFTTGSFPAIAINSRSNRRSLQQVSAFLCSPKRKDTLSKDQMKVIRNKSKELQSILLLTSKNQTKNRDMEQTTIIEELIQALINAKVQFDPQKCINGPLFAVVYQSGPIPFWEKYDFKLLMNKSNTMNIKGQRYRSITKDSSPSSSSSFDLVNYAEFWGRNLSIQGCGVCTIMETSRIQGQPQSPFQLFKNANDKSLLQCPVDYKVEIQTASVNILKQQIKIDVSGIGYTRILYADEELRILLAPKDTTDERWMEKAGLMVVQIRSDLVDPTFDFHDGNIQIERALSK